MRHISWDLGLDQDIRKMCSLAHVLPSTYSLMAGSQALIGFPLLTGFSSKDFY